MKTVPLRYSEELLEAVHLTPQELETHVRLMAALKMYELGKLSSAQAAELAGMSRVEFFEVCGRYRVPLYAYDGNEVSAEVARDAKTAQDARK
jgi:predicted HTH domain antitoxin